MTASTNKAKLTGSYLLWLVVGTVIGALLSSLACYRFQHHVQVFYYHGTPNSGSMQFIAALAVRLHPFALVSPALGPMYYCWRNGLTTMYLFICATPAAILGLILSPSIQGEPDQPHIILIPSSVFIAAIVALFIQIARDDWIDHETPRRQR